MNRVPAPEGETPQERFLRAWFNDHYDLTLDHTAIEFGCTLAEADAMIARGMTQIKLAEGTRLNARVFANDPAADPLLPLPQAPRLRFPRLWQVAFRIALRAALDPLASTNPASFVRLVTAREHGYPLVCTIAAYAPAWWHDEYALVGGDLHALVIPELAHVFGLDQRLIRPGVYAPLIVPNRDGIALELRHVI